MAESVAYSEVSLANLSKTLTENLDSNNSAKDGEQFVRAANVNTLLVLEKGYPESDVELLIETLSQVHPNRTFLIVLDDSCKDLKTEYSARCHSVGPKEHVCSEVVRIIAPTTKLSAVGSVVRANLMTGMPTELCIHSLPSQMQTLEGIAEMSDQVIFASSLFEKSFSQIRFLLHGAQLLVDLDWVKLGIWRDQVKEIFEKPAWASKLPLLERIEINGSSTIEGKPSAAALLMAGWLIGQLGLRVISGSGSLHSLISQTGQKVSLVLSNSRDRDRSSINELMLVFPGEELVEIKRGTSLDTLVRLGAEYRFSKPIDDENRSELIKRYFFIGESTLNYKTSIENAVHLSK